jgi:hypothetical protein
MINRIADLSQRHAVMILRILYPIWFVVGIFGIMYVPTVLTVVGDAAATAGNIIANGSLLRLGIISSLLTQLIHVAVVLVLYKLFKSVDENQSVLLVVLGLVGVPIAMLNELNRVAALLVLSGADYLKVFTTGQLSALAMFFLNLNAEGIMIATVFWGLWLLPLGILIYKSGYFPKLVGILMLVAGIGYTLDFFSHYLLPGYKAIISPIVLTMTMGEIIFMIWIILRGAKLPKEA